jgi:hypothetical protein
MCLISEHWSSRKFVIMKLQCYLRIIARSINVWIIGSSIVKDAFIEACGIDLGLSAKMLSLAQHPDYVQHLSVYAVSRIHCISTYQLNI